MAAGYYSPITVAGGQVPAAQSNFPALFLPTDNRFRTEANGGHVKSASFYDGRPNASTALSLDMTYELVPGTYNATTGFFEMWILFSSIDVGTVAYMSYGDPSLTTDGSSTNTWPIGNKLVWHLPNVSGLSARDSTSNGNNGTITGAAATTGKIDGGASFNGNGDGIISGSLPTNAINNIAFEFWLNPTNFTTDTGLVLYNGDQGGNGYGLQTAVTTGNFKLLRGGQGSDTFTGNASAGVWQHVVLTRATTVWSLYVNAVIDASTSSNTPNTPATKTFNIADQLNRSGENLPMLIDEMRVLTYSPSANEITTKYNNQSAPNTFWTLGAEVAVGKALFRQSLLSGLGAGGPFFQNPLN